MYISIAIVIIILIVIIGILILYKKMKKKVLLHKAEEDVLSGKDKEAEKNLLLILEDNPDDVDAYKNLIILYMKNGKYSPALERLELALNRPEILNRWDQKEIMVFAGVCCMKLNKKQKAYKYFLTVNGLDPNNGDALKYLAILEYQFENYEKADIYFKKCYNLKDKIVFDKEFVKSFGINLYQLGKYADSMKILSTYLNKYPNDKEASYFLGSILFKQEDYTKSLELFKKAIYHPKYRFEAYFNTARIYLVQNNKKLAKALLEKLINFKGVPKDILIESYYILGNLLRDSNKINDAVVYWRRIYNIDKNYKDVADNINKYSSLTSNEKIRIFSLTGRNEFIAIAKKLIKKYLGNFALEKIEPIDDATIDILVNKIKRKGNIGVYFRFIRDTNTVGEIVVKEFYFKVREAKCKLGVLITVGPLTNNAKDFIASRAIDLIDKNKLASMLKEIIT